jgi:hypothetical protein
LTNAFSKKLANHAAAFALYMMFYNCGHVHQTLRITPAMAAGVSDHGWSIEEMVGLLDASYVPKKRGPYERRASYSNSYCRSGDTTVRAV